LNLELALVYLQNIKNYQKAAIYLEKCIHLQPDIIDLYEQIFTAYKKSHDNFNASDACVLMGDCIWKRTINKMQESHPIEQCF